MQIFFSHSGRQKPLIREIKKGLPDHLSLWIDEDRLLFGDNIGRSLESTIKCDTDYVILFLDDYATRSAWVRNEIKWALETERSKRRTLLLIVVVDVDIVERLDDIELRGRKYMHLRDFNERSVRALSDAIASEVFALVCREIDRLRSDDMMTPMSAIDTAESMVRSQAALIRKIVFPHRRTNPISTEKLIAVLNSHSEHQFSRDEFERLLSSVIQQNLLPGVSYDGFEAFLIEEHASWKASVEHAKKEAVGKRAAGLVRNGSKVLLDAGSTTEEIVKVLCKKIENRALTRVTIGTTSVNIADMISDCCVKMGFDDEFSAVSLYIPGGQIRPNTQAIVPAFASELRQIRMMAESIGGFDICFVGVNAVTMEGDLTTHSNMEAENKTDMLSAANAKYIVGDSSKVGIALECRFAGLGDDVKLVVDNDHDNVALQELIVKYSAKIVLA